MDLLFTNDARGRCLVTSRKHRAYSNLCRGDAFRPLAVETYGCLNGPFNDIFRECARCAAASGTTLASTSTLTCFFCQRVFVALQHALVVAVRRRTMALDVAHAGLPSLPPLDLLHGLDIAHIASFPGAGCA